MSKMLALVSIACCLAQRPNCPTMEVSIVADKSGDSTRQISSVEGKPIFLTEKPLLTIADFTEANVSLTEGQFVLNVSMTTESAKRVQTFTANHVGKMIAFVVNGRLIRTPKIRDPTSGKGFLIGPFGREEAQNLANSINHKEGRCRPQGKNSR